MGQDSPGIGLHVNMTAHFSSLWRFSNCYQ